jgi:sugar phosphate isomerase/epimerase
MLTRRSLLKQMALITGGSMLLNESFALNAPNKKVGVQLYTVRNQIFKDPAGTLKKIAALGYQEVETFGYNGKFFGWAANEYKKALADLNMAPVSGHYGYGKFADKNSTGSILHGWEKSVEDAATVGHQYMV